MYNFDQYITERYVNLIGTNPDTLEKKELYKDEVWAILQKSYKAIGGIKGSGFGSPDDMVRKIPFWKLVRKNNKIVALVLYKDKGGRKSVAAGTDGTLEGKAAIKDLLKDEMKRSYGEKSKAMLGTVLKTYPWDVLEPFLLTPEQARKVLKKDDIVSVKSISKSKLAPDARKSLKSEPRLIDYGYVREIGGEKVFKVAMGTPGKAIRS